MKLIVKQDFSYSTNGYTLVPYAAGTELETENAGLIEVALAEGWAVSPTEKALKPPQNKALKSAPENK